MNTIARVGVDLAKHVLQVHAVDSAGNVLTNRALARGKFVEWCVHLTKRGDMYLRMLLIQGKRTVKSS